MVRRKVYRTKRNATTGAPTRYQLWVDVGGGKGKTRKAGRRRANPLDKAWTTITTWLRSAGGTTRRKTTTRRPGWGTGDVHPNLYRRHAQQPQRSVDEVARMRQRRRNRGKR